MNAKAIFQNKSTSKKVWEELSTYVIASKKAKDIIEHCTPMKKKMARFVLDERTGLDSSTAASGVYLTHKDCIFL